MVCKVVEIKTAIDDSTLLDNIYEINKLTQKMLRTLEFTPDLNYDDYNYFNIVANKSKRALEKVYELI